MPASEIRGYPIILPASTDAGRASAIISPKSPAVDAGWLIQQALRQFSDPVTVVLDRYGRKLYITADSANRTALLNIIGNPSQILVLKPDSGQIGNSLVWSVDVEVGTLADGARDSIVVASKPHRSPFAVFNSLAVNGVSSFAWLDQVDAKIGIADFADPGAIQTALAATTPEVALEIQIGNPSDFIP